MYYNYFSGDMLRQRLRNVHSAFRYLAGSDLGLAEEAGRLAAALSSVDYYTSNMEAFREMPVWRGNRRTFDAIMRLELRLTTAVTDAAWGRTEYDGESNYLVVGLPQGKATLAEVFDNVIILGVGADRRAGEVPDGYYTIQLTSQLSYVDGPGMFSKLTEVHPTLTFADTDEEERLAQAANYRRIRLALPEAPTALHARMMADYNYRDRMVVGVSGFNARGERMIVADSGRRGWKVSIEFEPGRGHTRFTPYDSMISLPTMETVERDFANWRRDRITQIRANGGLYNPTTTPTPAPVSSTVAGQKYESARNKRKHTEIMHIPTLPVCPEGTVASRTWGIEVETGAGRNITTVPSDWDSRRDGSLSSAYDEEQYVDPSDCPEYQHSDPDDDDYWDLDDEPCDNCGVVYTLGGGRSGDCVEIVSPILRSFHSDGLRSLTNDLEPHPVSQTAGLHVHVGADGLNAAQVRELLLGYDAIEWLIEASYKRQSRGYCKRRSARELIEIARHAKSNPKTELRRMPTGDRYVTVNLQSLSRHGTIEFRAMGPVYNYDHLIRWAMFCREMVNSVSRGARAKDFTKVREWADVLSIFQRFGIEYNDALTAEVSSELATAEVVAS